MYEDESLPSTTQSLAALVASKLYYHLGDINESLQFALGAGDRFDVERVGTLGTDGEFVEKVVCKFTPHLLQAYLLSHHGFINTNLFI